MPGDGLNNNNSGHRIRDKPVKERDVPGAGVAPVGGGVAPPFFTQKRCASVAERWRRARRRRRRFDRIGSLVICITFPAYPSEAGLRCSLPRVHTKSFPDPFPGRPQPRLYSLVVGPFARESSSRLGRRQYRFGSLGTSIDPPPKRAGQAEADAVVVKEVGNIAARCARWGYTEAGILAAMPAQRRRWEAAHGYPDPPVLEWT